MLIYICFFYHEKEMMVNAKEQLNNFNNPLIKIQQRKWGGIKFFTLYHKSITMNIYYKESHMMDAFN